MFFSEFFRPLGLEECLGGTLATTNGRFAMIGLHRAPDRKAFDDNDIARLEALMPHLARALQLRRSFLRVERKDGALTEICDRLAAGVIALDEHGKGLFANAAAQAMSLADDGLAIDRQGRPFAADRSANKRLAELEGDVKAGGSGGVVHVRRRSDKPAYVVIVTPLALDGRLETGRRRQRGTLFVIHDPLSRPPSMPKLIAAMFGLPQGTANPVAAIAAGEELKAYAERAGISMNTVRFHLKTAYARTGSRRQSELVRLVTAALRDLAGHHRNGG